MNRYGIVALVLVTASWFAVVGCGKKGPEPTPTETTTPVAPASEPVEQTIKVGVILPETGEVATYGQDTRKGMELALEQVNKAHPVKLELIFRDNESKSGKSQDLMTDLVTLHKVRAILGAVVSDSTLKMVDIANSQKIPLLTPADTDDDVTIGNPYVFRICYTDTDQGKSMARFAREVLHAKRAAVLEDDKSPYSVGLSRSFRDHFTALGGEIVSVRSFGAEDQDFSRHLDSIRKPRDGRVPDVVAVPAYYEPVGKILRQAKEKGLKCTFVGSDGWDSPELYKIAGANAKGHYFTNHFALEDPSPQVRGFVEAYEAKYGGPPSALSALGYDAVLALSRAVNNARALTGPAIRDAIADIRDLEGVTGRITIDEDGNARKDVIILKTGDDRSFFKMRYPAEGAQSQPSGEAE